MRKEEANKKSKEDEEKKKPSEREREGIMNQAERRRKNEKVERK